MVRIRLDAKLLRNGEIHRVVGTSRSDWDAKRGASPSASLIFQSFHFNGLLAFLANPSSWLAASCSRSGLESARIAVSASFS